MIRATLWWVALVSFGEGWHNNHHANPVSARHGVAWYEVDPTYWQIRALEKLGIAKAVYAPSLAELEGQQQKDVASGLKAAA